MIALAVDGAKRMQVLIQDLLAYAKVDHQPRDFSVIDLQTAVAEATRGLELAIAESRATVMAEGLSAVRGDRRLTVQLLRNLLSNAIKYRDAKAPAITVETVPRGEYCEVRVTDNGIGIAPRHQARLFGMFKRLHGRERYAGNGIGLAIRKKIAELHGGRIWVESELGRGSTFAFTLPAVHQRHPPTGDAAPGDVSRNAHGMGSPCE